MTDTVCSRGDDFAIFDAEGHVFGAVEDYAIALYSFEDAVRATDLDLDGLSKTGSGRFVRRRRNGFHKRRSIGWGLAQSGIEMPFIWIVCGTAIFWAVLSLDVVSGLVEVDHIGLEGVELVQAAGTDPDLIEQQAGDSKSICDPTLGLPLPLVGPGRAVGVDPAEHLLRLPDVDYNTFGTEGIDPGPERVGDVSWW